jgi:hypothetical protein
MQTTMVEALRADDHGWWWFPPSWFRPSWFPVPFYQAIITSSSMRNMNRDLAWSHGLAQSTPHCFYSLVSLPLRGESFGKCIMCGDKRPTLGVILDSLPRQQDEIICILVLISDRFDRRSGRLWQNIQECAHYFNLQQIGLLVKNKN